MEESLLKEIYMSNYGPIDKIKNTEEYDRLSDEAEKYYGKLLDLGDASYARRQEKLYIVLLEKQGRYAQALERMEKYIKDYVTQQDEEYEEAQKEHEFLKRIQSE